MSWKGFWTMTGGKVVEGVFALHKPQGITSAQCLRDLQKEFNPSKLFAPWLSVEKGKRAREQPNQRKRRKMKNLQVKIGHGGTLDPMATGVLIAGIGKGTKALGTFLECTKTYETVVLFGAMTDTYDTTGKILKRGNVEHLTKEMVEEALGAFRGKIMQRPPIFSALKMNGKPLYEYAREGKEIPREIEKRPVEVKELVLVEWMEGGSHKYQLPSEEASEAEKKVGDAFQTTNMEEITGKQVVQEKSTQEKLADNFRTAGDEQPTEPNPDSKKRKMEESEDDLVSDKPTSKKAATDRATMSGGLPARPKSSSGLPAAKIKMTVTSGFYVRSLAFDLGLAVGSQATMAELVRTRQGKFELGKNVLEFDDIAKGEEVWGPQVEAMLEDWTKLYRADGDGTETLGESSGDAATGDAAGDATGDATVDATTDGVTVDGTDDATTGGVTVDATADATVDATSGNDF